MISNDIKKPCNVGINYKTGKINDWNAIFKYQTKKVADHHYIYQTF